MKSILKFDSALATTDFRKTMGKCCDEIIGKFYDEATMGSRHKSEVERESSAITELISETVIFYANSIMESYGTGSKLDTNNPFLDDYANKSGLWNPARNGNAIVGRPEGYYYDIYGEKQYSSGKLEGVNLEKLSTSPVKAREAKHYIQNAEKWLMANDGMVRDTIKQYTNAFIDGIGKYLKNTV